MDSIIIGIAGGTGSGKTTLTRKLKERFGQDVSVISHDNYYKRHDELPYEERCKLNYDHPDAFDTDLMVEQIEALRRGETIACPVYDLQCTTAPARRCSSRPPASLCWRASSFLQTKSCAS